MNEDETTPQDPGQAPADPAQAPAEGGSEEGGEQASPASPEEQPSV